MFGALKVKDGHKRMDDDSDDDDQAAAIHKQKMKEPEVNLLDFNEPSKVETGDLLGGGLIDFGTSNQQPQSSGTLDLFNVGSVAPVQQ